MSMQTLCNVKDFGARIYITSGISSLRQVFHLETWAENAQTFRSSIKNTVQKYTKLFSANDY